MTIRKNFFIISVPVLLLSLTFILSTRPYYNWDLFPYMALAERSDTTPFDSTHAEVFREAARQMPQPDYAALANRHPDLVSDPKAFQNILPYFEIKPLYILVIRCLHFAGVDLVTATYLPSLISYFLITLLLFWWFRKIFALPYAALVTLTVAIFPFLTETARYSSPDMLSSMLLVAGLFFIAEYYAIPGIILSGAAILVRPDASLFFLLLLYAVYQTKKIKTSAFIIAGVSALLITLSLTGTGMLKEFLFTSADYSGAWGLTDWVRNYFQGLRHGLQTVNTTWVLLFVFIALMTLYVQREKTAPRGLWHILVPGTLILLLIRFLLHPVMEDRMLIPYYLLIIIGFCKSLTRIKTQSPVTI